MHIALICTCHEIVQGIKEAIQTSATLHANNTACTDSVLNSYLSVKTEAQTIARN